ncbi:FG-GAP repeat domain-containing protein [Streptomyces sp. NPDC058326]|uniref:FG-GAP repeat domain-containing protein n=1 Tax=Streptomyces sp. NPDC058326 TaxID=3346447 RepID=UPI0036EB34F5
MLFTHSRRARRLVACTALALSAGMLFSGTASADSPAPQPTIQKKDTSFTPPQLVRPGQDGARAGAQAAAATSPLLSDLDLDGIEDLVFRAGDGIYTTAGEGEEVVLGRVDVAKDIIPIGNQAGEAEPEMLVLSENGTLTLYRDVAEYGTPYEHSVGGGWQAYNKITSPGDVNGDGKADVIARTPAGQLYVYIATGDVTKPLGARILVGSGWGAYDQLVGLGDGNGDGLADMYARDRNGTLWFYTGTGDKNHPFATRKSIGGGWNTYNQILPAGNGALWARDNSGTMYLYIGKGDGTLNPRQKAGDTGDFAGIEQFALGGNIPYTGKDGFLARDTAGTLFWYGPSTTGKVTPRQVASGTGEWKNAVWTAVSSMNPDNMQDTVQNLDGDLWIDGAYYIGSGWGIYNAFAGPGDLSGDGKGDLLARDRSGVLYLYKGNGEGDKFATRIRVGSGWGGYNKIFGGGDYTGDGRADLLARTTGGDLYLYAGTGNATTPFGGRVKIGSGWGTYKHLAAAGDLNADGKGDIVGITSAGDLYTYLNTTPGKFSTRARFGGGFQIYNQIG